MRSVALAPTPAAASSRRCRRCFASLLLPLPLGRLCEDDCEREWEQDAVLLVAAVPFVLLLADVAPVTRLTTEGVRPLALAPLVDCLEADDIKLPPGCDPDDVLFGPKGR